ncbi:MAG: hypothetical protein DI565_01525 [Ancylobacter novellus]|uniref:Uncharacterized protein n=1 Tax=Ancylobacter novellus TaxID=921 RepID=A0A2W5KPT7_ANCNO|nr:MAG: hypothetical protein DI565_01525 [Ancylobacter novellus]
MLDQPSDDLPPDDARSAEPSALRASLRRARAEAAEQTDVVMDLRQAEIARLEILKEALDPVFAEAPEEVDIFDVGLVPGERPRLFVDMVAFVEMGRDRRTYRFMRDGRHGRVCVAESEQVGPIVEAVTAYVARRLVERERLLVDDDRLAAVAAAPQPDVAGPMATANAPAPAAETPRPAEAAPVVPRPPEKPSGSRWLRALAILLAFAFGAGLGALMVGALLLAAAKGKLPL